MPFVNNYKIFLYYVPHSNFLSKPAAAIRVPSGDHATEAAGEKVVITFPFVAFQTCAMESPPAEATLVPSGDHVTLKTRSVCPVRTRVGSVRTRDGFAFASHHIVPPPMSPRPTRVIVPPTNARRGIFRLGGRRSLLSTG